MVKKIEKKIVSYKVANNDSVEEKTEKATDNNIIQMHEKVSRPEALSGSTYKIKTPLSDHALYLTINDIILNEGTDHELRRPFDIFNNSKNMDHALELIIPDPEIFGIQLFFFFCIAWKSWNLDDSIFWCPGKRTAGRRTAGGRLLWSCFPSLDYF